MPKQVKKYTGTLQEQLQQYKDDRTKTDPEFAKEGEATKLPPLDVGGQ